jgi:hypothetical protein
MEPVKKKKKRKKRVDKPKPRDWDLLKFIADNRFISFNRGDFGALAASDFACLVALRRAVEKHQIAILDVNKNTGHKQFLCRKSKGKKLENCDSLLK